ncbi:unnamed protein product [Linum trigynum]|uniref:Uncharacterized protein n=1 Tax=Linum trigynum TaxID=586398 RepID=A0AAV2GGB7_9ROSI
MKGHFIWILKATGHGIGLRLFFNNDEVHEASIWADLFLVNFWQIPKGYYHRFQAIFPKCHFLSILEATDQGIRPQLFSTDNEVY